MENGEKFHVASEIGWAGRGLRREPVEAGGTMAAADQGADHPPGSSPRITPANWIAPSHLTYTHEKVMSRTVTLRLSDDVHGRFKSLAEDDNRPLSNFIETAALRFVEDRLFADEFEMEDIRGDRNLSASLQRGMDDRRTGAGPPCRFGRYRLFYIVDQTESVIFMLTADLRGDAYNQGG